MSRKQKILLHLRHMWATTLDRLQDLWNITLPIFLVSGLLVASFRFWLWILPA